MFCAAWYTGYVKENENQRAECNFLILVNYFATLLLLKLDSHA